MGFSNEACKKALIHTGNNNIEAATNWVMEHQSDPDFDAPHQSASTSAPVSSLNDTNTSFSMYKL
jgi:ubiquitin carboxyl-terminal hydrolase 5/13